VTFAKPSASVFRFSPPPGARVTGPGAPTGAPLPGDARDKAGTPESSSHPRVIGKGWTAVIEVPNVRLPTAGPSEEGRRSSMSQQLSALTRAMTPVSGAYGSGQVLRTKLVSVLLLDDGRMFVGAVAPEVLEQVAAT
jgi:hypothetical protein